MQFSARLIISIVIAAAVSTIATFLQGGQFPDLALLATFTIATVGTALAVGLVPADKGAKAASPRRASGAPASKPGSTGNREQGPAMTATRSLSTFVPFAARAAAASRTANG